MDFQGLLDRHVLLGMHRQEALVDLLAGRDHQVDLGAGVATAGDLALPVGLLGTTSEVEGTWLWGWANPSGFPDAVLAAAGRAREHGVALEVEELTTAEVALSDGFDGPRAAVVGAAVAGVGAYLAADAGPGTAAYLGVEREVAPGPPDALRAVRLVTEALQGGLVRDWPTALQGLADGTGGRLVRDGPGLVLELSGGRAVRLRLDDLGRVAQMDATAGPQDDDPGPASAEPRGAGHAPQGAPPRRRWFGRRG